MNTEQDTTAGFSTEERQAIRERAAELKQEATRSRSAQKAAADEADMLAKIEQMPAGDRQLAERVHAIITATVPDLVPRLYYGQPAWARGGKVVLFFRSGQMDKERYSTFGVTVHATLDEDSGLWPTSYALTEPTEQAWQTLTDIVRRATAQ